MIAIGVLLLPLLVLTATLEQWLERRAVGASLAAEAARALAVAPDWVAGRALVDDLEERAEARLASSTRSCPEPTGCLIVAVAGGLIRDAAVRVEVSVRMPGLVVPFIGTTAGFWSATGHTEIVDPYRSLPG